MKHFLQLIFIQILAITIFAQTEILTNKDVILMTQSGLNKELIIMKVKEAGGKYDVSAQNLIDLKKAGVDDSVIESMMEKAAAPAVKADAQYSDSQPIFSGNYSGKYVPVSKERIVLSPKEALQNAKTIAITK